MLTRDEVKQRMGQHVVPGWKEAALVRARQLPEPLEAISLEVLGPSAIVDGTVWARQQERPCRTHAPELDSLTAPQRQLLFEALMPKVAVHLESLWQLWKTQPNDQTLGCMGFRLPNSPHLTVFSRYELLRKIIERLGPYGQQDITWFADWGAHHAWAIAHLLAGALNTRTTEGDRVLDILREQARGQHEVGFGIHVPRALLRANRPEGWQIVEDLLLNAGREEGLRHDLLESLPLAHPDAFRRMLHVILEHDLVRFSSVVRGLDVWVNYRYDSCDAPSVRRDIELISRFLEDPDSRAEAWAARDANAAYLALLAAGWEDAEQVVEPAGRMLTDRSADKRFAAAYVLLTQGLPAGCEAALVALDDEDPCIRGLMALAIVQGTYDGLPREDLFERFEGFLDQLPAKSERLQPKPWPWMTLRNARSNVADGLVYLLGRRPVTRLVPHLKQMSPGGRFFLTKLFEAVRTHHRDTKWNTEARELIRPLLADVSEPVQNAAFDYIRHCDLSAEDILFLEAFLSRKASAIRQNTLGVLLRQPDEAAMASAERLLQSKDRLQRLAGLEILRQMAEAKRQVDTCRKAASAYRDSHANLEDDEQRQLAAIGFPASNVPTLDDALGLIDVAQLTQSPPARDNVAVLDTPAARALLQSLDDLVHENREAIITIELHDDKQSEILGNAGYRFPWPDADLPLEDILPKLPLADVWRRWWQQREANTQDPDGLELLRAKCVLLRRTLNVRYDLVIEHLIDWLIRMYPAPGSVDLLLDVLETGLARLPVAYENVRQVACTGTGLQTVLNDWHEVHLPESWRFLIDRHQRASPEQWTAQHRIRLWHLANWLGSALPDKHVLRGTLDLAVDAYHQGAATEADLIALILRRTTSSTGLSFPDLGQLSRLRPHPLFQQHPFLRDIVNRCRERILEIELQRGETPTAATEPARALRYVGGLDVLLQALAAMGGKPFARGSQSDRHSRIGVFSHFVRCTVPGSDDTPQVFAARVKEAGLTQKRLLELAMYVPLWAPHVEHAIGWPGLAEGVWWLHAHTKDDRWLVDQEIQSLWTSEVGQRTPLSAQDLKEGAVDVAWFRRVYELLGQKRWRRVDAVAPLASTAGGHKRAQLFADAMRGRLRRRDLLERIRTKRHLDAVRAFGLMPLPDGPNDRKDLLCRYEILQEFLRQSRQFGMQRQASERRAFEIGMQNLAGTAGYIDPLRLQWAMETEALGDLARGPVKVVLGDVQASLSIDEQGRPDMVFMRAGKPLKAAPASLKDNSQFKALQERKTQLRRQASRTRISLESAMCRGDRFTGQELQDLCLHPILAPMLARLVLVGEGIIGYPVDDGQGLQDHAGHIEPVRKSEQFRVAHPHDLLTTNQWHLWQRDCFARERIQPFKQVFRELYVLTQTERQDAGCISRRYAGHQVHPAKAMALLGSRQWIIRPEEGVHRTFHADNITAWLTFLEAWSTPALVEGATIESVQFMRRQDYSAMPLEQVPPRLFSEVMRDIDLVVSVAHRSGIDPEASASTVEMRAALVRETCRLLGLNNIRLRQPHVLVDGQVAHYSVHLGSGIAHQMPGGMLFIVPVHAQHRGRLFLPFADDDPKTAEIISKVLLLARDEDIKDPSILRQIRG